jgi:predicted O-methyltransferase YrrM
MRLPFRKAHRRIAELEQRLDHERLFPVEWANRRVRDRFGNVTQAGPFQGLRYPDWAMTAVDAFSPKLIGSYEQELHGAVERAIARAPRTVVNVGGAEGYYAVGLARRLPDARVVAFEPREEQASQLRAIAELNDARVETVARPCTPELLAEVLHDGALVVCDCDGCEEALLDLAAVPALRSCELIVETHDIYRPGLTERLEARFASSHRVERIEAATRFVQDFPQLDFMPLVTQQLAISEFRPAPQRWLVADPRL